MELKERSRDSFNHQAFTYDTDIQGQHARALYPVLLKILSGWSYQSILDLGCGTGELLNQIQQKDKQKKLFGIDISENMLEVARKKLGDSATLVLGDTEHLPFADGTFDIVCCNDSFHHYPSPENVAAEVCRVLKPGGYFLIGDCWQPSLTRHIMNFFFRYSKSGDVKIYSEKELRNLLQTHFHSIHWKRASITACISYAQK